MKEDKKYCKYCGEKIDRDSIVCSECGRKLNTIDEPEVKKEENVKEKEENVEKNVESCVDEKPKFYNQAWFIGALVFVAVLVVCLEVFNSDTKSSLKNEPDYNISTDHEKEKISVEVVDFSLMTKPEIEAWCNENGIKCIITNDYSDFVETGKFVSQSVSSSTSINQGETITVVFSLGKEPTVSQKNAKRKAESYLEYMAFSRSGLIHQLEYEGFSNEDATYGVDNISVDWNMQAVKKAKSYLDYMAFSRDGLIHQLEFEGFTHEQAVYGATQNGL